MSSPFDRLLPPAESTRVVVSRHWARPKISVTVNHERIELFTSMEDFLDAIAAEMGSPLRVLTRAQMRSELRRATLAAIEKVKEASGQAVGGA